MKKNFAIILMIIVGIVSFIIGYSMAPTDVETVRKGAPTHASSGAGGGADSGGYGGGADSGGYGGGSDSGGYGAPSSGGYGAPASGGYGM